MIDRVYIELSGCYTSTSGQFSATSTKGATHIVARQMIASGINPSTIADVFRGSTRCFIPLPLSWWAERSVREGDKSAKFVKYQAMPEWLNGDTA